MELLAIDPADGSARVLIAQRAPEGGYLYPPNERLFWVFLQDGRRFIVRLEHDGWQHLFLCNIRDGSIRQRTSGPFPVRDIAFVGEENEPISPPLLHPARGPPQTELHMGPGGTEREEVAQEPLPDDLDQTPEFDPAEPEPVPEDNFDQGLGN